MKTLAFYLISPLTIFYLIGQASDVPKKVRIDDYQEECFGEECDSEEIRELCEWNREEVVLEPENLGADREELIENGGTPARAIQLIAECRRRGFALDGRNFMLDCSPAGTETKCAFIFLLCRDSWFCPDGRHHSSWYVCGGCIFGSF